MNIAVFTRQYLLAPEPLALLQRVLVDLAPTWARAVRLVYDERNGQSSVPVDLARPGVLFDLLDAEARRPPSTFVLQVLGPPPPGRLVKSFHLAGADDALLLFVHVDNQPLARVLSEWRWSNTISAQVLGDSIGGQPAHDWARRLLEALSLRLGVDYGHAYLGKEYWAKNVDTSEGARAIGLDVSKALPGLYWLNYFGPPYVALMGRERLLTAPAASARGVGAGVLLEVHPDPRAWSTPEYRAREAQVLDHLGRQYFFSKDEPDRPTVGADLGIPMTSPK